MFNEALWEETYEVIIQRNYEDGAYKEEDIEYWVDDYYNYLKELQDVTKNSSNN